MYCFLGLYSVSKLVWQPLPVAQEYLNMISYSHCVYSDNYLYFLAQCATIPLVNTVVDALQQIQQMDAAHSCQREVAID